MLDANGNYFASTIDLNSLEMIFRADVNVQMNKSDIDDTSPPETNLSFNFLQTDPIVFKTSLITLRYNPQIIISRGPFPFLHLLAVYFNLHSRLAILTDRRRSTHLFT